MSTHTRPIVLAIRLWKLDSRACGEEPSCSRAAASAEGERSISVAGRATRAFVPAMCGSAPRTCTWAAIHQTPGDLLQGYVPATASDHSIWQTPGDSGRPAPGQRPRVRFAALHIGRLRETTGDLLPVSVPASAFRPSTSGDSGRLRETCSRSASPRPLSGPPPRETPGDYGRPAPGQRPRVPSILQTCHVTPQSFGKRKQAS